MASKLGKVIGNFEVQLSAKVAVGGTTATLSSILDKDGNTIPNGRYFLTIDPDNSKKEHFSCVITGTAVTQLKTINRTTITETSGALREHKVGAKVIITDFAVLAKVQQILDGVETLDSASPIAYDGLPNLTSGEQIATVQYVLNVVTGGTVNFDKQIISGQIAGEALALNDVVYLKEADAKWYKADADIIATFNQAELAITKTVASTSGDIVQIQISGPVAGFTGLTPGSKYYLSNTSGLISTSSGTYSSFIGWALSSTTLIFEPTKLGALIGSQGVPSANNKFITEDNTSNGGVSQSQLTQNSSVEFAEADVTTKKQLIAQSFKASVTKIKGVNLYKTADTGTFTGTVSVGIKLDSAGSPTGSNPGVVFKTFTNSEWLSLPVGAFEAIFDTEYTVEVGTTYWIVVQASTNDTSNHPNLGINTAGGYSDGILRYFNTTDSWVTISTVKLYFSVINGTFNQIVKTNSAGKIEKTFFALEEMLTPAYQQRITRELVQQTDGACSNADGSVLYIFTESASLVRYQRDTLTGAYLQTHRENVSFTNRGSVTLLGSYVYIFFDNGTNMACYRYLASDLSGETAMTMPAITAPGTNNFVAWSDQAFLYSTSTGTTVYKFSVAGTVLTQVSTSTASGIAGGEVFCASLFDGTTAYIAKAGVTGDIYFYKLNNINGSSTTLTQFKMYGTAYDAAGPRRNGVVLAGIDTQRMYIGSSSMIKDSTNNAAVVLELTPITKP